MVARELTKVHQEFIHGTAAAVAERLVAVRGEFTVVVGPGLVEEPTVVAVSDERIAEEFGRLANQDGPSRREALASVARKVGKSRREVYAAVERAKKSGV
jgi:16S rRNA (cytidine1402-2'-O)-methyltransferase